MTIFFTTPAPSSCSSRWAITGRARATSRCHAASRVRTRSTPSLDQAGVVARAICGPAAICHANPTFAAVTG